MTPVTTDRRRLDPRDPLVIDTRELGRRAGSLRHVRRTVPAPVGLGTAVVGVPAGGDVDLDLRLESVMEGVLVTGTAEAATTGECGRCLEPIEDRVAVDIQELFVYPEDAGRRRGQPAPAEDDVEDDALPELVGDALDLGPTLLDAVVLALPLSPLCEPDCPGLCVDCGERLAVAGPDHSHTVVDPRWASLAGLTDPAVTPDFPTASDPQSTSSVEED